MQARPPGVVGDANIRTPSAKRVDSIPFGRSQIDAGEDTEPTAAVEHRTDILLQQPETVPLDECTDQVDLVGGGKLAAQLVAHAVLVARVHEERAGREWDAGPLDARDLARGQHAAGHERTQLLRCARHELLSESRVYARTMERFDDRIQQTNLRI